LDSGYSPLEWAAIACDTLTGYSTPENLRAESVRTDEKGRKFLVQDKVFQGARWRYNHGLFMVALQRTYKATGKEDYINYSKRWADDRIDENGNSDDIVPNMLDSIQPGLALFPLYEKYGEPRYKIMLDRLYDALIYMPKTKDGGYWHTFKTKNQIWLDGLYMAEPFMMEYCLLNGKPDWVPKAAEQARIMTKHTRDGKTGLLYHGWDESGNAEWADSGTGCSSEFWGRAIGWYCFALADILEKCPRDLPEYSEMKGYFTDAVTAVLRYQSESGLWYQIIDKGYKKDNWYEVSATCLFLYSILKGVDLGLLEKSSLEAARNAYKGIFRFVENGDEGFILSRVCGGTNVGDYAHYIARGKICNDYHGVGAFILACLEYERVMKKLDLPGK
jgi:unsaturated rhamnogalacturonyl hydrolase